MGNHDQIGADSYGHSIAVDSDGNVYTYGLFSGPMDFDPGPGIFILNTERTFIQKLDPSGNFIWAKEIPVWSGHTDKTLAIDAQNNLYMTGGFQGTVDVDLGADVFNLTEVNGMDVFVLKLDSDGNFIWAKSFGNTSWDRGASLAVDANQNVYTCGFYTNEVDFDPGPGVFNLAATNRGMFIQKLDASGNFLWAKSTNINVWYYPGYSIALDDIGNVYTTGNFQHTTDFDPGVGTFNLTAVDREDIFIQKLDTDGNFIWAKAMGGALSDVGLSITVDANRNIYTTGYFYDTADFDPGNGTLHLASSNLGSALYIQKLDEFGALKWAKHLGGVNLNVGQSIAVDAQENVYTTGMFNDIVDFDPGPASFNLTSVGYGDIFIQKLDKLGEFVWALSASGDSLRGASMDIAVDESGGIYTTGFFESTTDFDPGPAIFNINAEEETRYIYVQKLNQCKPHLYTLGNDTALCEGQSFVLEATIPNATYLWHDHSTEPTYHPTTSGSYWVDVDVYGCTTADTINVQFNLPPRVDLGKDTTLCEGEVLILNASKPNVTYQWQDNSTNPTFTASEDGIYSVVVHNACGIDSDELRVELIECECSFYIPNSFTPNGDRINDEFSSKSNCDFLEFSMLIFNRWGQIIFETNSPLMSWDGKYNGTLSPIGMYIYQVNFKFKNELKTAHGSVSLIR